jgi:5-formyltetrahydrofolate cyclo-ligase
MAITTKAALREDYIRRRNQLPAALRAGHSARIAKRLLAWPAFEAASSVLIYVSFGSEVDTHALIRETLNQGKRVAVPLCGATPEIGLSELRRYDDLAPGPRPHLLEPSASLRRLIAPSEMDLALVPGIVFDRGGGRIGRGGGYFDRVLDQAPWALHVALAFSAQLRSDPVPVEPHDRPMHAIITEREVLETGFQRSAPESGAL